jgi:hypothetical protein
VLHHRAAARPQAHAFLILADAVVADHEVVAVLDGDPDDVI